jgi:hypothetical protein
MAESLPEQIEVAIQNRLGLIVGDGGANYWLTPTKVVRVPGWAAWEMDWLDKQFQTLYFLKPGLRTEVEDAMQRLEAKAEWWILAATQYVTDTLNPIALANEAQSGQPLPDTLQNRMERDIKKGIRVGAGGGLEITLGISGVFNVETPDWNHVTPYVSGWAIIEGRIRVTYLYRFATP